MKLDHIFVVCRARLGEPLEQGSKECAARVASAMRAAGFQEGESRSHPGQGTANRRFFFNRFMFELLYVDDEASLDCDSTSRFSLRQRFVDPEASPFGIAWRPSVAGQSASFDFDRVYPPYLPEPMSIEVARVSTAQEPLLFHLPFVTPFDEPGEPECVDDSLLSVHANGAQGLVRLSYGHGLSANQRTGALLTSLGVHVFPAPVAHLSLAFTTAEGGEASNVQLSPEVPVILSLVPCPNAD